MLLLAIWPAITSHALLQHVGLIHEVHDDHHGDGGSHEHNDDHHIFADGDYTFTSAAKTVSKPESSSKVAPSDYHFLSYFPVDLRIDPPGPAPPGAALPHLQQSWQFLLRAALPVRAPSFIS
jgi:hypothetical protein